MTSRPTPAARAVRPRLSGAQVLHGALLVGQECRLAQRQVETRAERRQPPSRAGVGRVAEAATGPVDAHRQGSHGMIGLGKGQAQRPDRHLITVDRSGASRRPPRPVPTLVNSRQPGRRVHGDSRSAQGPAAGHPEVLEIGPVVRVLVGDDNGVHLFHGDVPLQVGQRAAAHSPATPGAVAGDQVAAAAPPGPGIGAVAAEDRHCQRSPP